VASAHGDHDPHGESAVGISVSTHGYLFADIRGYTAFVDRRGAAAAAALVDRFRVIVRAAVSDHQGAEIRTEGDSFYVVFPSASQAVACGLAIVGSAATESGHTDDPIPVGVGIHAGEAVPTSDGPIGTAVNIAARLCSMAAPGEVLVSDTVRSLTRSVGDAAFVAVGRRKVKGLDEPIAIYRAAPPGETAQRAPGVAVNRALVGLAAVIAVGVIGAIIVGAAVMAPAASLGPSAVAAATEPAATGLAATADEPSTPAASIPEFRETTDFAMPFEIAPAGVGPGVGWTTFADRPDRVTFTSSKGAMHVVLLAAVLDPPCYDSEPTFLGDRPEDVMDYLTSRPWIEASAVRPYNVGPYLGRAVEVTVTAGNWTCPDGSAPATALLFRTGDPHGESLGGAVGRPNLVVAFDVGGRTVTALINAQSFSNGRILAGRPGDLWDYAGAFLQTIYFPDAG
jgi:class 3 adenylate cyclase